MKEVVISIHSTQNVDNGNEDSLDFVTDGVYDYDEDSRSCRLTYFETEITGLAGTRTRMFFGPDQVVIKRDGTLTSRMDFKEKQRSTFLFDTPYGSATIGMRTRKIDQQFDANGGHAVIDYVLDLEHASFSNNRFEFTVKEQQPFLPPRERKGENA